MLVNSDFKLDRNGVCGVVVVVIRQEVLGR